MIRDWRMRRARQRRRRKAAVENRHQPLREFVYLDEVSVFSLLASRIGALATEFTDSETSSLNAELKGTVGAGAPIAKAEISSTISGGETTAAQVMRKATVQSTFRELHGYIRDELLLRPPLETERAPKIETARDLFVEAERASPWVVAGDALTRGAPIEVDVQLEADGTFRASAVFSTIMEFLEDLPRLPEALDLAGLGDAVGGTRMLNRLLAGLVPIRGRALDYLHASVDGHELIVHRRLTDDLPAEVELRPLAIVGVAEEALFWRDLRRVLFSGARYRMLCRVARDGPQTGWTPVKLLDVLGDVDAGLRTMVEAIPDLLRHMAEQDGAHNRSNDAFRDALVAYTQSVLDAGAGRQLSPGELAHHGLPTMEQCELSETFDDRRKAFELLTEDLAQRFDIELSPRQLATFRAEALTDAGLLPGGRTETTNNSQAPHAPPRSTERYLDCEIVAVYW